MKKSGKRILVITEEMAKNLKMTEYKFNFNIRDFLAKLLNDPVNAIPSDFLQLHGVTRNSLLKSLISMGMVEKHQKLSDKDDDGNLKKVTMKVRYAVPKKNFKHNMKKLFIKMFENTERLTECEGGATCMSNIGGGGPGDVNSNNSTYEVPYYGIFRQRGETKKAKKRKHNENASYPYIKVI